MSAERDLPWKRGETQYGTGVNGTVPTSGADYTKCGTEYLSEDPLFGRPVRVRAVKNASGITLYGRQPVQLNAAGTQIIGYANRPDQKWVPIDDLGSTGVGSVGANDCCFVVIRGVGYVRANAVNVSAGDYLHALTLAASTGAGTTANGIEARALTSSVTGAQTHPDGEMARAISAATNGQTTHIAVLMDARLI